MIPRKNISCTYFLMLSLSYWSYSGANFFGECFNDGENTPIKLHTSYSFLFDPTTKFHRSIFFSVASTSIGNFPIQCNIVAPVIVFAYAIAQRMIALSVMQFKWKCSHFWRAKNMERANALVHINYQQFLWISSFETYLHSELISRGLVSVVVIYTLSMSMYVGVCWFECSFFLGIFSAEDFPFVICRLLTTFEMCFPSRAMLFRLHRSHGGLRVY